MFRALLGPRSSVVKIPLFPNPKPAGPLGQSESLNPGSRHAVPRSLPSSMYFQTESCGTSGISSSAKTWVDKLKKIISRKMFL